MSDDIRELAIQMLRGMHKQSADSFADGVGAILTTPEIERLVRAAMREGMMRAADACKARATIPQEDIQSYMESGNSGDIASAASDSESHGCANAIRAEADKLEGK